MVRSKTDGPSYLGVGSSHYDNRAVRLSSIGAVARGAITGECLASFDDVEGIVGM